MQDKQNSGDWKCETVGERHFYISQCEQSTHSEKKRTCWNYLLPLSQKIAHIPEVSVSSCEFLNNTCRRTLAFVLNPRKNRSQEFFRGGFLDLASARFSKLTSSESNCSLYCTCRSFRSRCNQTRLIDSLSFSSISCIVLPFVFLSSIVAFYSSSSSWILFAHYPTFAWPRFSSCCPTFRSRSNRPSFIPRLVMKSLSTRAFANRCSGPLSTRSCLVRCKSLWTSSTRTIQTTSTCSGATM